MRERKDLKLLNMVVNEYINIVEYLAQTEPIENNRIVINRDHFRGLLEKYAYMKFNQKTKVYKQLNFIIHDKNNYTIPWKDRQTKKTIRKVIINYETYTIIKHLSESEIS